VRESDLRDTTLATRDTRQPGGVARNAEAPGGVPGACTSLMSRFYLQRGPGVALHPTFKLATGSITSRPVRTVALQVVKSVEVV
jgi:hypothetical protein